MNDVTLLELTRWGIGAALAYFSYEIKGVRILGMTVDVICLSAVLVQRFVTTGLFPDQMFLYGLIVLGACYLGHQKDRKSL